MNDDVFERIAEVVRSTFHLPESAPVGPTTTSADVDGWDSLSHSILIMRVEDAFDVELPLDAVYALPDVGALAELVRTTRTAQ